MAVRHAFADITPLRTSPVFRRLWIGRSISGFGTQMTMVAVMYQVWRATGSTVWTGAVGIAQAIPVVVFGLFAGALVDRGDRRRLYLIAVTGQAACSVVLAVQGLGSHLPPAALLGVLAVQSCFVALSAPASRTFIPRLLPRDQVAAGMALNRITFQAAMLTGPALGGLIIGASGVGGCYVADAVSFAMAFYGAFGLPALRPEGTPPLPGVHGVLEGLHFLVVNRSVRGALLTDLAATALSFPISLFPLINAERFHNDPRTFGLFLSALAVGGIMASVFAGVFTRRPHPGRVMLGGAAVWGLAVAGFGLVSQPWIALGLLVVAGAADTISVVSRGTLVQLQTPDRLRGRVASVEQMVGQAGPDVGNLRAGLLASATSGVTSLVTGGLMCFAAVAAVGISVPELRSFSTRRPVAQPVG